jgi:imidazolonepropionase-like amidohydrolase
MNVLVEGNLIKKISSGRIQARPDATVIDGGGRTLIPGLIDAHAHLTLHGSLFQIRNELGWMYLGAKSGAEAQRMLMRGFTTARDTCGAAIGLRKAIDAGHVDGPRIYAAGPCLSQTGGHGDFRGLNEVNYYFTRTSTPKDVLEYFYLADGVPEVQKATREMVAGSPRPTTRSTASSSRPRRCAPSSSRRSRSARTRWYTPTRPRPSASHWKPV